MEDGKIAINVRLLERDIEMLEKKKNILFSHLKELQALREVVVYSAKHYPPDSVGTISITV